MDRLSELKYPESALSAARSLEPLLKDQSLPPVSIETGKLPFIIVIADSALSSEERMSRVSWLGKPGVTKLNPQHSSDFHTIASVSLPPGPAYLLLDIDRGKEYVNVRPEDALVSITANNRSPLTIDEGIAIITHYPEFLVKNNCFSLLASRHPGDQRVPAIWINGQKQANLGWCWDRNPHTWLGSASCARRVGL